MSVYYLSFCFCVILAQLLASTVGHEGILGGIIADHDKFHYQVLLHFHTEKHECGGGIIGDQWILTAAHCLYKPDKTLESGQITVQAGTHDMLKFTYPAVRVDVKTIYFLKHYVPGFALAANDIAILKLVHPLGLSSNHHLKKLQLPHRGANYVGEKAEIAGFGWTWINKTNLEEGGHNDTLLRYALVDVLHPAQHGLRPEEVPPALLWARIQQHQNHPRGACVGDSGGPLVHDGKTVIGILSGGPADCTELQIPSAYTDVSMYLPFIEHVLHGQKHDDIVTIELPKPKQHQRENRNE